MQQTKMILPAFYDSFIFHPCQLLRHIGTLKIQISCQLLPVKGYVELR